MEGVYSVTELANLVHPKDGHKKSFVMLQAYFDESGIHDDAHTCVVAGYTGSVAAWKKFERPWRRLLKKYSITEFHAQKFWSFQGRGKRASPFHTWADHEATTFLAEAFAILEKSRVAPIAAAVPNKDWRELPREYRHFLTGGDYDVVTQAAATPGAPTKSYYLALAACISNAARHALAGTTVHFVLDLNQQLAPYAIALFQKFKERGTARVRSRLGSINFDSSEAALPLQAADMLAFLIYQHVGSRQTSSAGVRNELLEKALCNLKSPHDIPLYNSVGLDLVLGDLRSSEE